MGQIIIPDCGCCPSCCGKCPQLSGYPCQFYYFTNGRPFVTTGQIAHVAGEINIDINAIFFQVALQVLPLFMWPPITGQNCKWTVPPAGDSVGDLVATVYYDAPSNSMVFSIRAFGNGAPALVEELLYSLPLSQFNPSGDNIMPFLSDTVLAPVGGASGFTSKASSVIITPLAHDHKGNFFSFSGGGLLIDNGPVPDFPCACPVGCGCTQMPGSLTAHIPAFDGVPGLTSSVPLYQGNVSSDPNVPQSLSRLYAGCITNSVANANSIVDRWIIFLACNSAWNCAAYSATLYHDVFPFFGNGNFPVGKLVAAGPASCNCPPAPMWLFNSFAVADGLGGNLAPFADASKASMTVTL